MNVRTRGSAVVVDVQRERHFGDYAASSPFRVGFVNFVSGHLSWHLTGRIDILIASPAALRVIGGRVLRVGC